MPKVSKARKEEAKEYLLKVLNAAPVNHAGKVTVNCILRHVSKSGMMRVIDLYVGDTLIGPTAADFMEDTYVDKYGGGIKATGCGMDMGFHLVSTLSAMLYRTTEDGKYVNGADYKLDYRWL